MALSQRLQKSETLVSFLEQNKRLVHKIARSRGVVANNEEDADLISMASMRAYFEAERKYDRNKSSRMQSVFYRYMVKYIEEYRKEKYLFEHRRHKAVCAKCGCESFTTDFLNNDMCIVCGEKYVVTDRIVIVRNKNKEEESFLDSLISDSPLPDRYVDEAERDESDLYTENEEYDLWDGMEDGRRTDEMPAGDGILDYRDRVLTATLVGKISTASVDLINALVSDILPAGLSKSDYACMILNCTKYHLPHMAKNAALEIFEAGLEGYKAECRDRQGRRSSYIFWAGSEHEAMEIAAKFGDVLGLGKFNAVGQETS